MFEALASAPLKSLNSDDDELDAFLMEACVDVVDAVAWWYDHRKAYPRLSRMALDYLTIPGMCSLYL